jgi:hypothetical protein
MARVRRHCRPARVACARTRKCDQASQNGAKQGQKDDCLIHALVSLS